MTTRRLPENRPQLKMEMQTESEYELCASRLKALADPDRLRILNSLLRGSKNVTELADEIGATIVKVSHHLGVLRAAQVVQTQKQGKFVIYSLPADVVAGIMANGGMKSVDLGCCQLELVQPDLPHQKRRGNS